jgi:hypothetical protein
MCIHPVNRLEILETECDFSLIHQTLRGLPKNCSIFGWKFRPGDGYVSDDEADDGTVSTGTMDSGSDAGEPEFLQVERVAESGQGLGDTHSMVSSTLASMEPPAPVSFQELIHGALDIMKRLPPKNLTALAVKYYGQKQVDEYLREAGEMHFFTLPPTHGIESTAPADWVLKQRSKDVKAQLQDRKTRRNEKKRIRSKSPSRTTNKQNDDVVLRDEACDKNSLEIHAYLKLHSNDMSVIALGFGPGDNAVRLRRKARKIVLASAIAALIVAITVGVSLRYEQARFAHSLIETPFLNDESDRPTKNDDLIQALINKPVPSFVVPSFVEIGHPSEPLDRRYTTDFVSDLVTPDAANDIPTFMSETAAPYPQSELDNINSMEDPILAVEVKPSDIEPSLVKKAEAESSGRMVSFSSDDSYFFGNQYDSTMKASENPEKQRQANQVEDVGEITKTYADFQYDKIRSAPNVAPPVVKAASSGLTGHANKLSRPPKAHTHFFESLIVKRMNEFVAQAAEEKLAGDTASVDLDNYLLSSPWGASANDYGALFVAVRKFSSDYLDYLNSVGVHDRLQQLMNRGKAVRVDRLSAISVRAINPPVRTINAVICIIYKKIRDSRKGDIGQRIGFLALKSLHVVDNFRKVLTPRLQAAMDSGASKQIGRFLKIVHDSPAMRKLWHVMNTHRLTPEQRAKIILKAAQLVRQSLVTEMYDQNKSTD